MARRLDMPLKVAAKIGKGDQDYYDQQIRPLFKDPHVEFVGEIGEGEKQEFLGNAAALLFPVDWPEPFGLVMIEAMACGTPVIAFRCGSIPEVMQDGVSGFIVDTVDQAVDAVERALQIPRARCRAYFEERFLARRMAEDYLAAYEALRGTRVVSPWSRARLRAGGAEVA
jgi:glycosyltransferase involved in cell wall biosynthesis